MLNKEVMLGRLNEITKPIQDVHDFLMDLNKEVNENLAYGNVELLALNSIEEAAAKLADLKLDIQVYGEDVDD